METSITNNIQHSTAPETRSMMFRGLGLGRVTEIVPNRFTDSRGFFCETYNKNDFLKAGIVEEFVQDNNSCSSKKGTLRGLHFQLDPMAQAKLVRVVKGTIFDVAVDITPNSPGYGKWVGVTLSSNKGNQLFIPAGFAHGFVTLEDDTEVAYKVDNFYSAELDRAIRYDDPAIAIDWPELDCEISLSSKDDQAPYLSELKT